MVVGWVAFYRSRWWWDGVLGHLHCEKCKTEEVSEEEPSLWLPPGLLCSGWCHVSLWSLVKFRINS